jgi:hypothetical protein
LLQDQIDTHYESHGAFAGAKGFVGQVYRHQLRRALRVNGKARPDKTERVTHTTGNDGAFPAKTKPTERPETKNKADAIMPQATPFKRSQKG